MVKLQTVRSLHVVRTEGQRALWDTNFVPQLGLGDVTLVPTINFYSLPVFRSQTSISDTTQNSPKLIFASCVGRGAWLHSCYIYPASPGYF